MYFLGRFITTEHYVMIVSIEVDVLWFVLPFWVSWGQKVKGQILSDQLWSERWKHMHQWLTVEFCL